jgi:hypothetical protein
MVKRVLAAAICLVFTASAAGAYPWRLVASYPVPRPNPRGFQVSGVWSGYVVEAASPPYVYKVDLPTGSILSSFPAPGGTGAWGITAYTSSAIYISNNRTSWIYKVTSTGSLMASFLCPVAGPADMNLSWLSGYLNIAIPGKNAIAIVTTAGSLVGTFAGPATADSTGLAA